MEIMGKAEVFRDYDAAAATDDNDDDSPKTTPGWYQYLNLFSYKKQQQQNKQTAKLPKWESEYNTIDLYN